MLAEEQRTSRMKEQQLHVCPSGSGFKGTHCVDWLCQVQMNKSHNIPYWSCSNQWADAASTDTGLFYFHFSGCFSFSLFSFSTHLPHICVCVCVFDFIYIHSQTTNDEKITPTYLHILSLIGSSFSTHTHGGKKKRHTVTEMFLHRKDVMPLLIPCKKKLGSGTNRIKERKR